MKKIGIASDHGGFELKEFLRKSLAGELEIVDYGTKDESSVDYPIVISAACKKVLSKEVEGLIALCGTGIGASIAANRMSGIRAALCHDQFTVKCLNVIITRMFSFWVEGLLVKSWLLISYVLG
ncbi:sugar-phosphate isomerase, RpiB/LacA/LacB family [Leptospira interrogans str. UT126]|nr:sugar-phosphate isomerase, RpiB/LacA/LacB family [Leptospira interrogans str. UT126]